MFQEQSPMDLALKNNHTDIVNLLAGYNAKHTVCIFKDLYSKIF